MIQQLKNWFRQIKRFVGSFYFINKNKLLGRSFVLHPRKRLFIEPVSYCNLACKFCTYPKNLHPKAVMDKDLFMSCVDQAAAMGFECISLTPINGDIFIDKNIIERLLYIENSSIKTYQFYTNFIGANETIIKSLFTLKKLSYVEVSIYGHDFESFCNITRKGKEQYSRLVENLTTLESLLPKKSKGLNIHLGIRTYRSFQFNKNSQSELLEKIENLRRAGVQIGLSSQVDNWGGEIGETDIAGIEMDLVDGGQLYKKGPCGLPFDSVQITAEGMVNACACRDPRGSLLLGDLNATSLAAIHSPHNEKWMGIINDHESGQFKGACSSCGFYQSIYDERRSFGYSHIDPDNNFMAKSDYLDLARGLK